MNSKRSSLSDSFMSFFNESMQPYSNEPTISNAPSLVCDGEHGLEEETDDQERVVGDELHI